MRERERDGEEFAGEDYKHVVFFYFGKGTWAPNATAAELDDPYARTESGGPRSVWNVLADYILDSSDGKAQVLDLDLVVAIGILFPFQSKIEMHYVGQD